MPDLPLAALERLMASQPRLDPSYRAHLTPGPTQASPEQAQLFLDRMIATFSSLLPNVGLSLDVVERDGTGATLRITPKE